MTGLCSTCGLRPRTPTSHSYCRLCRNAHARRTRKKHAELTPEQRKRAVCRAYTNVLIRRGHLVRQPCEGCGDSPAEAHHEDYSDPRTIRWLCTDCHRAEHAA